MNPTLKRVTLNTPLPIGKDKTIDSLQLRRPLAGDLRGVKLVDLMQMDTSAVAEVVARISEPLVNTSHFWGLAPDDLATVCIEVVGFFEGSATRSA